MSEEIDEIVARAMHPQIWGTGRCEGDGMLKAKSKKTAARFRAELLAAGYRIELDPDFLLQKGRDAGVVLND